MLFFISWQLRVSFKKSKMATGDLKFALPQKVSPIDVMATSEKSIPEYQAPPCK